MADPLLTFNDACAEALAHGATVERGIDKADGQRLAYVDATGPEEALAELHDLGWLPMPSGSVRAYVDPAIPYVPPGEGRAKPPRPRAAVVVDAVAIVRGAAEAWGVEPAAVLAMTADEIRGRS